MNVKVVIFKMLSGSVITQAIGLLISFCIVLNYSSSDVGMYGFFYSSVSIFSILLSLRMENLIYRYNIGKESKNFTTSLIIFSCLLLVFLFLLILSLMEFNILEYNENLIIPLLFSSISYTHFNIILNYLVRTGLTDSVLKLKIIRVTIEFLMVVSILLLEKDIYFSMYALGFGYFIASVFFYYRCGLFESYSIKVFFSWIISLKNIYKYSKFDFPASVLNVLALHLPQLILQSSGNVDYASLYFQLNRFIGTPLMVLSQSIGLGLKQCAQQEMDTKGNCNESAEKIKNIVLGKYLLFITIFSLVIAIAIPFVIFESGLSILTISVSMIFVFISRYIFNSFSSIVYVLGLYKENFTFQIFLCLSVVILSVMFSTSIAFLPAYSFLLSMLYLYFVVFLYKNARGLVKC